MKLKPPKIRALDLIDTLATAGRYDFTSGEAREALRVSAGAAKLALNRLAKRKRIAAPARGFYVIVPPEYRPLGCLPADQFIPALMARQQLPYYAGLLSAAQYHGAAHHRPQVFQVMLEKPRRSIRCGRVQVAFITRKRLHEVPTQLFNTPRGTVRVSTPEATAVDLIGYAQHAGGLDQVATVLLELAERIDPEKLAAAAQTAPLPWAQRLGYVLEQVGAADTARLLKSYVAATARQTAPLVPGIGKADWPRDPGWKLIINGAFEPET